MKRTGSVIDLEPNSKKRIIIEERNNTPLQNFEESRSSARRVDREPSLDVVEVGLNKRELSVVEYAYNPLLAFDLCKEILSYLNYKQLISLRIFSQLFRCVIDISNRIQLSLSIDNLLLLSINRLPCSVSGGGGDSEVSNIEKGRLNIRLKVMGSPKFEIENMISFVENPLNESTLKHIESLTFLNWGQFDRIGNVVKLLNLFTKYGSKLSSLSFLYFSDIFYPEAILEIPTLPSSIRSIHFDTLYFKKLIVSTLPDKLSSLIFRGIDMERLSFGQMQSFPRELSSLLFSGRHSSFQTPALPEKLETFGIGDVIDRDFRFPVLPKSVRTLQLDSLDLIEKYGIKTFPENIKSLKILYNRDFLEDEVTVTALDIPSTLEDFYFGGISEGQCTVIFDSFPENLKSFSIGQIIGVATIKVTEFPPRLKSFHIEFIDQFAKFLFPEIIPDSLECFTFGKIKEPEVKKMLEGIQAQVVARNQAKAVNQG